jgi:hypothetical protein
VHPLSGQTEWLLLPTVTAEVFTIALAHFAQALGVGKNKRVPLVLDRAGWHTSKELLVPEGIHLLFLPSYSPELQQMSNACGPSVMKALPIVGSKRSMTWRQHRSSAVPFYRTSLKPSTLSPTFIGGLLLIQNRSNSQELISIIKLGTNLPLIGLRSLSRRFFSKIPRDAQRVPRKEGVEHLLGSFSNGCWSAEVP